MKSATSYNELRNSKILILPNRPTLCGFVNTVKPSAGFNPEVVTELAKMCKDLSGIGIVVLSFDEIKIQSNLGFDKHSGDVIEFVNVGDNDLNFATFSDTEDLATRVVLSFCW